MPQPHTKGNAMGLGMQLSEGGRSIIPKYPQPSRLCKGGIPEFPQFSRGPGFSSDGFPIHPQTALKFPMSCPGRIGEVGTPCAAEFGA